MALQASGAISLTDIATEFGGTTPHSLSEYYSAAAGLPASGAITFDDFYGLSSAITVTDVELLLVTLTICKHFPSWEPAIQSPTLTSMPLYFLLSLVL